MEFNEIIKSRRLKLNKTLEEIAEKCNVSKATVQRWESGEIKNVRRDKIANLAIALDVTPAYLMGWDEEETKETYHNPEFGDYEANIKHLANKPDLLARYIQIDQSDNLSLLFDKSSKISQLSPQDMEMILNIIDKFAKEVDEK